MSFLRCCRGGFGRRTRAIHAPFAASYSSSVLSSCSNRQVFAALSKCTRGSLANAAAWASAEEPLARTAGAVVSSVVDITAIQAVV